MANHEAPRPGALIVVAPYLRPERVQLGWSMVLATSLIGIRLASPWPLALAVDHALRGKPFTGPAQVLDGLSSTELLVAAGLATVVLAVLGGLIDATSSWVGGGVFPSLSGGGAP